MCLHLIDNSNLENLKNGIGYKIFLTKDEKIYNNFFTLSGNFILYSMEFEYDPIPKNEILNATEVTVPCQNSPEEYTSGFHIFLTLEDAKIYLAEIIWASNYKIFEVEYYDAHTKGIDEYETNVIVAPKMKILKQIN